MPTMTDDRITFDPNDRNDVPEQSPGITADGYNTIFTAAAKQGITKEYFKFLEEIAEKDPDIRQALDTRSAYVTSKEWQIEDADGETELENTDKIDAALRDIAGDRFEGLLTFDQLLSAMVGVTYLTGLSFSEIVADLEQIKGFNYIPCHYLTFQNEVYYPQMITTQEPEGRDFNKEKMISHYASDATDPARGYLGNAISWQYVFRRQTMDSRDAFQKKYGKGFLLINMPMGRDGFEKNWNTAESLIQNYSITDGAVFEGEVEADFKESMQSEGDYFFNADDRYEEKIIRIILGQDSTTSSESSNRSTADVHMEVLEQRIIDDMTAIEDTINSQLIPKIKEIAGVSEDEELFFKFVVSEMEATLDEEMNEEGAIEEETDGQTETTPVEDENDE
jgi:phage gp29-like protein